MSLVKFLCLLVCAFAAAGFVLSLVTGRRRLGRAYECATWFGGVFGGIALITAGAIAIPEKPQDFPAMLPGLALCSIGIALLAFGFTSEMVRARRADQSAAIDEIE